MGNSIPFNPKTVQLKPRGQNVLSKSFDIENNCIVRVSLDSIGSTDTNYDKLTDATEKFTKVLSTTPQGSILIMEWGNDRLDVVCTNPLDDEMVQDYLTSNPYKPKYLFETYQKDENGTYRSYAKPKIEAPEEVATVAEEAVA